jgi:hypothetical protein
MAKIKKRVVEYYSFYCAGCKCEHSYIISPDYPSWSFNGDINSPSFTPSLLNRTQTMNNDTQMLEDNSRCHLFVTNGKIEYLSDCTHEYAGKTLNLLDL